MSCLTDRLFYCHRPRSTTAALVRPRSRPTGRRRGMKGRSPLCPSLPCCWYPHPPPTATQTTPPRRGEEEEVVVAVAHPQNTGQGGSFCNSIPQHSHQITFFSSSLHSFKKRKLVHLIFRSRRKFSTTYAIVSFFFSRPFMKISNSSKTVRTISIKFCTVILHPKGALRAQRHQKSYDWNVRNIANISPKMTKNGHFWTFYDFLKNFKRLEQNFLQSFYATLGSYVCNDIKIV